MENTHTHDRKHNRFVQYFIDSYAELSKVTWPTKIQAVNICVLVVVFVFAAALVFAGVDYVFNLGYEYLLNLPVK